MKTALLLLAALSSAAAFVVPQVPAPHQGLAIRRLDTVRFMTEQTTLEKKETTLEENAVVEAAVESQPVAEVEDESEMSESEKLLKQVKEAGTAGVISYAAWELAFWALSVPVCIIGYRSVTGHFPDLSDKDDLAQLGAEAFAFVNFARFAVPLRIGLALGTTPWVQENVVDRFMKKDGEEESS
eukprot:CAMPEP_0113615752 /NCGR_PEP_ID=MMETSP0017_2-20120614/7872_1 /TAXON_ID=2856 /ORGANISM="Cylindrotheca closterium" /LENGTH=183 /DNA_ID=CAMNT_0000525017 /DNA_START=93 /DNA_END=644 /DNA_ORIENTATION=+ /assembly_acc=CAM_ASM_000147